MSAYRTSDNRRKIFCKYFSTHSSFVWRKAVTLESTHCPTSLDSTRWDVPLNLPHTRSRRRTSSTFRSFICTLVQRMRQATTGKYLKFCTKWILALHCIANWERETRACRVQTRTKRFRLSLSITTTERNRRFALGRFSSSRRSHVWLWCQWNGWDFIIFCVSKMKWNFWRRTRFT